MDRRYPNDQKTHLELEKVIGENRIFNKTTLINKMDFYRTLVNDPLIKKFLPDTKPFLLASDLDSFLRKYGEVFLKPVDGMKGRGIIQVLPQTDGLLCNYMEDKIPVSETIADPQGIYHILKRVCRTKREYIIQAGVQRMKYRERPFNFRVNVLKDGHGTWSVPAVFARIASPGGFLTNNSAGAEFILLRDLFASIRSQLPYSVNDLLRLLRRISVSAAVTLDGEFGPLGKLGMDIVIDTMG